MKRNINDLVLTEIETSLCVVYESFLCLKIMLRKNLREKIGKLSWMKYGVSMQGGVGQKVEQEIQTTIL